MTYGEDRPHGAFCEKAIFLWCYWDVFNGDTKKIAAALKDAIFEAVYVHASDGTGEGRYNGRINCTPALVADLKAAGLVVYGWGAPYGNPIQEAEIAASQTMRYGLAGYIFDAETTWDKQPNAVLNTTHLVTRYQALCPGKPVAWCWWPMHRAPTSKTPWHPVSVLREAMKYCDVGMPMAYWSWGDTARDVARYVDETWVQWREVTNKPIVMAGRAWNGDGGFATRAGVEEFDRRSRELGAVGISWWDMQHAVRLPSTWQALTNTPGVSNWENNSEEENMNKDYAIGLYTAKANWTNTGFHFIVGFAGDSYHDPNPDLKPMELKAAGEGKPFLALYKFNADFYTRNQYPMDKALWPSVEKDEPLQMFIRALTSRDVTGVIVQVADHADHDGKTVDPGWISFAAEIFCARANDWLKVYKPKAKFFVGTSNHFISRYAPNMNNWAYKYNSFLIQDALPPLDASYPREGDKPAHISVRTTWEFWHYYHNLVLFCGTPEKLRSFFGFSGPTEPAPDPGGDDQGDTTTISKADFDALKAEVDTLIAWKLRVQS